MEIVKVIKRKGRDNFEAEWHDPQTGERRRKSLGTNLKRTAERAAGKLEQEILSGQYTATRRDKWSEFRKRYLTESTEGLAESSIKDISSTLNTLEGLMKPATLQAINESAISKFTVGLQCDKRTKGKHLRNIKRMLRWANRQKLITEVPTIQMPKGISKGKSKGRAITFDELERMVEAVPKVRTRKPAPILHLLWGLWHSGLRLDEARSLSWEPVADAISIDSSDQYPCFLIPGDVDKSKQERMLPMAPEFWMWLTENTPEAERVGLVFENLPCLEELSKVITAVGESAGVVVNPKSGKFASAHDFRRAFGKRWAQRVDAHELQKMMRHENIKTTLEFYVDVEAQQIASKIWQATGLEVPNCTKSVPRAENEKTPDKPNSV